MKYAELEKKIELAKDLSFGEIFQRSIELFKKTWLQGLIMLLLTFVCIIPFYLIIYFPLGIAGYLSSQGNLNHSEPNGFLIVMSVVGMLILITVVFAIGIALKAAFYRIIKNKDFNLSTTDDYFFFFKKAYLGKLFTLTLAFMGILTAAILVFVLPLFYVIVPLSLAQVIFALNPELSVGEIFKASFKLGNKKWLLTFGLLIVSSFLAQFVGLLACGVGIILTASFALIPVYFIYKDVVDLHEAPAVEENTL